MKDNKRPFDSGEEQLWGWYLPLLLLEQEDFERQARQNAARQALLEAADALNIAFGETLLSARALLGRWGAEEQTLAARVPFYELSLAAIGQGTLSPAMKQVLRELLRWRPGVCRMEDFAAAVAAREPLFRADAALSADECGAFWSRAAACFPHPEKNEWYPEPLERLLNAARDCFEVFAGPERAQERSEELWDGFDAERWRQADAGGPA